MSEQVVSLAAGILLSLIFSYFPGVKEWFNGLSGDYKRLIMLGSLLLVSLGIFGLGCLGRYEGVTCDVDGLWQVGEVFLLAAIANQSTYTLTNKG